MRWAKLLLGLGGLETPYSKLFSHEGHLEGGLKSPRLNPFGQIIRFTNGGLGQGGSLKPLKKGFRLKALIFTPKKDYILQNLAQGLGRIEGDPYQTKIAQTGFTKEMAKSGQNPIDIVEERGLKQISDPDILLPIIDEVISKTLKIVETLNWNKKAFWFLLWGRVFKRATKRGGGKFRGWLLGFI